MKIAHIADVHIRNLKYHDVYTQIFEDLYASLREHKPDAIVVCGDIAHTKTQISPEYVRMASDFFRALSEISPTLVIPGNHDGNLKNAKRLDAITPVYENIKDTCPDLHYMKEAGIFEFKGNSKVVPAFYHLSVFSPEEDWPSLEDGPAADVNIALYHGLIRGVKTDTGYVVTHGDVDISAFAGFDFVMLGDVHRTNQLLDDEGKVRYPGSLIQQNFGETNDKGYLLWDISGPEDFTCEHIKLENPKPFITIEVSSDKIPSDLDIPSGSRVRVSADGRVPLDRVKKIVDFVKINYDVESVSYRNNSFAKNTVETINDELSNKNLRDLGVQAELIKNYLKDFSLDEETVSRVLDINRVVDSKIESDDVYRNVNWAIRSVKFDNLFNYSEGNSIEFDKVSGIVGIFGPNRSGKSSIVDAILFALFNTTSKPVRRSVNFINQNKEEAFSEVLIEMNDDLYKIRRTLTKKQKKNGEFHASTDAEFSIKTDEGWKSLNGNTRWATDASIRQHFGTVEDFLMTSMTSQFGSLMFIEQKSTDRRKILAKFLDLEIFEEKYQIANEELKDIRGAIRLLEKEDHAQSRKDVENELSLARKQHIDNKELCQKIKQEIESTKSERDSITESLSNLKAEAVDIDSVERELNDVSRYLDDNVPKIKRKKENIEEVRSTLLTYLSCSVDKVEDAVKELIQEDLQLSSVIKTNIKNIEEFTKHKEFIENAPCNSKYTDCTLVKDAKSFFENLHSKEKWELELTQSQQRKQEISKILNLERALTKSELEVSKTETKISEKKARRKALTDLSDYYYGNVDTIKNKREYESKLKDIKSRISNLETKLRGCESDTEELTRKIGYLEQKIENIDSNILRLQDLRKEYQAYDFYKSCVHNSGIPFEVIKMRLPVINEEMSKILTNIVKFDVMFENNDDKLDINIKYPKYEPREIEMGSGAEKMISAMAIRLALLSISSLPKGDIFVLDEPATELDEDSMEGFTRILDSVKDYFKNVILISHIDALKDVVDQQVIIERRNGYAHVEV